MQTRKAHTGLTVMEAIDNLSYMVEVDLPPHAESLAALSWLDPQQAAFNRERMRKTFEVLLEYMTLLYEKGVAHLEAQQVSLGIQAIMLLAEEAVQKIDANTEIFKRSNEEESAAELKEFKQLKHFYHTKISGRIQTPLEVDEKWQVEWGSGEVEDIKKAALVDLEVVRRDREYELFQIRNEEGKPYFNRALMRHMEFVAQFDTLLADPSTEDPFVRIRIAADKNAHLAAKEIVDVAAPHIDAFSKEAMKFKTNACITAVSKALMALMLAANSRNLLQNVIGKSSLNYYADFCDYLRAALNSAEYIKYLTSPPEGSGRFLHTAVNLIHVLCGAFFSKGGSPEEAVALIDLFIEKGSRGSKTQSQTSSPLALWNNLIDKDQNIRSLLLQYPNGPLLKVIKLFNEEELMRGFQPVSAQNLTHQLFTMVGDEMHMTCLRLPCPVSQYMISKAKLAEEFEGFLRAISSQRRNQRHLLFNLQDRTSWKEYARCLAVEEVQKNPDYVNTLKVVTLPKDTDFYLQAGSYVEWDDAKEFMKGLKEQVASGEQCGFFIPPDIGRTSLLEFVDKAMKTIHTLFFGGKSRLLQKNRQDFIEIFYLFLSLKWIEDLKPDSFSFTCKDAVDTGAAAGAELFAFLRMMNDPSHFSKEEENLVLWMVEAPALLVRDRAIDIHRFNRMTSALSLVAAELEAHRRDVVAGCGKLFKQHFFKALKVA